MKSTREKLPSRPPRGALMRAEKALTRVLFTAKLSRNKGALRRQNRTAGRCEQG
jgi:hypothetical protein